MSEIDPLASLHALANELAAFDCIKDAVPRGIDVPDDYEAGLHDAAARLRRVMTRLTPAGVEFCKDCGQQVTAATDPFHTCSIDSEGLAIGKFEDLETAKRNVSWLLEHSSGLVDMHGLSKPLTENEETVAVTSALWFAAWAAFAGFLAGATAVIVGAWFGLWL